MKQIITLLSTKNLTAQQNELIRDHGIALLSYDAIYTVPLVDIDTPKYCENAIFTSKNSVNAISNLKLTIKRCFCVGYSTKKALEKLSYHVVELANNAQDLANIILDNYQQLSFSFFCGNLRRNELPEMLSKHNIKCNEYVVYQTRMNYKEYHEQFDSVLFFSPSAVKSYISKNTLDNKVAFCIGNTTANEAIKYTDKVEVAEQSSIQRVIEKVLLYYKESIK